MQGPAQAVLGGGLRTPFLAFLSRGLEFGKQGTFPPPALAPTLVAPTSVSLALPAHRIGACDGWWPDLGVFWGLLEKPLLPDKKARADEGGCPCHTWLPSAGSNCGHITWTCILYLRDVRFAERGVPSVLSSRAPGPRHGSEPRGSYCPQVTSLTTVCLSLPS